MNTLTVKAKAQLAAARIKNFNLTNQDCTLTVEDAYIKVASIIEDTFAPDSALQPIFAVAAFSSVVGCGIYRIGDPGKLIAIVPPQAPPYTQASGISLNYHETTKIVNEKLNACKIETERVARLVLQALNAS